MIYYQQRTNEKMLNTLNTINAVYYPNESKDSDVNDAIYPDETLDVTVPTNLDRIEPPLSIQSISTVEYSSAIAYLTKIQEVSSQNNSSSLLALVYTIISSLILTYGAKMLRLGENDKDTLVRELGERTRQDISLIDNRIMVKTSISNVVVTINSATSSLQLLLLFLNSGNQARLETINASFMDSLSVVRTQLNVVLDTIRNLKVQNIELSSLTCALILFEQNFDIYKANQLPPYIDDSASANYIVNEIQEVYAKISNMQSEIDSEK